MYTLENTFGLAEQSINEKQEFAEVAIKFMDKFQQLLEMELDLLFSYFSLNILLGIYLNVFFYY